MSFIEKIQNSAEDKMDITLTKSHVYMMLVLVTFALTLFIVIISVDRIKKDPVGTKITPPSKMAPIYEGS